MHDDILKKLAQRVDRRSFLRGSGLAAAAVVGAAAFPLIASAQSAGQAAQTVPTTKQGDQPAPEKAPDKTDDKKDDKSARKEDEKDAKNSNQPDPFKETKKDEQGRDYRVCPQCGYNMYKQDRTWTCENCGYSYTE